MAVKDELFAPGYDDRRPKDFAFNVGDVFRRQCDAESKAVFDRMTQQKWADTARRIWQEWGDSWTILYCLMFSEVPKPPRRSPGRPSKRWAYDESLFGPRATSPRGQGSGPVASLDGLLTKKNERRPQAILRALHEAISLQVYEKYRRPWGDDPPHSPVTYKRIHRTFQQAAVRRRLVRIASKAGGLELEEGDVISEVTSKILKQGYTSLDVTLDNALINKVAAHVGMDAAKKARALKRREGKRLDIDNADRLLYQQEQGGRWTRPDSSVTSERDSTPSPKK
jgi:hypothetical protein